MKSTRSLAESLGSIEGNKVGGVCRPSATVGGSDKRIGEDERQSLHYVPCKMSALKYFARRNLTSEDNRSAEEMAAQFTMFPKDHPARATPPV